MSDELQRIIEAERAAPPQPPVGSASAGWQRLQRSVLAAAPVPFDLAPPPVVETLAVAKTGASLGVVGKVLAIAAIVGATTATIVVTRAEPARTEAVQDDAPSPAKPRVREDAAAPAVIPPPIDAPAIAPPIEITPVQPEAIPAERPRKPRAAPVVVPPPAAESSLERERALVAASQAALADGRSTRALDLLDQHARSFPHGVMAEDRDALRVVALCAAGRADDAAEQRTKFFRRWPKSLHASRVRAACGV